MSDFLTEYERKYGPMRQAMQMLPAELYEKLVALCQRNLWLKKGGIPFEGDPYFEADSPYSFCSFDKLPMLRLYFEHGNWSIRQGVVYRDLFFCNQVNGGDEWWTCKLDPTTGDYVPFESITFRAFIKDGSFKRLIEDMLTATPEQCRRLEYGRKDAEV